MKNFCTPLAAVALLVTAGAIAPAYGQDAKAGEVMAQTRKALGDKKLEALKTFSAQAAMDRNLGSMQMSSDIELFVEMPDKFLRADTSQNMGNRTMNSGFNGEKAITPGSMSMGGGAMIFRMGPGGPVQDESNKPTPEQLAEINRVSLRNSRTELSRMMLGWFGSAHSSLDAQYTYAGEAESPDGKAHVIDVKNADGFEARLFIDQNNHLPLMVTYKARKPMVMTSGGPGMTRMTGPAPAGAAAHTRELSEEERRKLQGSVQQMTHAAGEQPMADFSLFFDDWRSVDGLMFPHKMRRAMAGETTEEWTFTKVKVNPKIDAAKFAVDTK